MVRLQRKRFSEPANVRTFPRGRVDVVELDDVVVGRMTYEPGWRWSTEVKPIAGTELCEFHHVGLTLSGWLRVGMPDGTELELGPGDVFEIPPGHDAWVVGDVPWVSVDWEAMRSFGRGAEERRERVLATVLVTDIVDSTALASALGRSRWRELLAQHNELAQRVLDRHQGRLIKTTGDGLLALFDGTERAVQAAAGIADSLGRLDLRIRAGLHTGEVELLLGDVRGLPVHIAARIMSLSAPGEVLVSSTVRDLLEGSDLVFEDRGSHQLKGVNGTRQLFALAIA